MILDLEPDVVEGLERIATAEGLSIEGYLRRIVSWGRVFEATGLSDVQGGMVRENGIPVYRGEANWPAEFWEDVVGQMREARLRHVLGDLS